MAGRVGSVKVVAASSEDEGELDGRGEGGMEEGGVRDASDEGTKGTKLERRRQERAAQIETK